jgi:ketosteroid isomerase-like protein
MTHSGPLLAGRRRGGGADRGGITVNGATVAEFRGGRICSLRQYWDELGVFEQIGLMVDGDD